MDYISRHLNRLFSQALTIFLFLSFFIVVKSSFKSIYLCIYSTPRENYVFILNAIQITTFASLYSENTWRLKVLWKICIPQRFNCALICHRVEDPIHIIGDSSVDSGEAFCAALFQSIAHHAVLDDTYRPTVVYTGRLQGPAAVTQAGIHTHLAAGTKLLVPDLRGLLVYFFTLFVDY